MANRYPVHHTPLLHSYSYIPDIKSTRKNAIKKSTAVVLLPLLRDVVGVGYVMCWGAGRECQDCDLGVKKIASGEGFDWFVWWVEGHDWEGGCVWGVARGWLSDS